MNEKTTRSFIAINLPKNIKKIIKIEIDKLKETYSGISWTDMDKWHLTLRFLGEINESQIKQSKYLLKTITQNFKPFQIEIASIGLFPNQNRPRLIAVFLKSSKMLLAIQSKIESVFNHENIGQSENRKYFPHITLGKIKDISSALIKDIVINNVVKVKQVDLMKSQLSSRGSHYEIIEQFNLCQN